MTMLGFKHLSVIMFGFLLLFVTNAAADAPTISGISPGSGAVWTSVTITGSNFGSFPNSSTVSFNGASTASFNGWNNGSIIVLVPSAATTGNVVVTVGGVASNPIAFTVLPTPTITAMTPSSGPPGTSVTLTGSAFGSPQGSSNIFFNGWLAQVTAWTDTSIKATVPDDATFGPVSVTVASVTGIGPLFTVRLTAQVTNSLGNSSSYVGQPSGKRWSLASGTGSGCSSCTTRGNILQFYNGQTGTNVQTTDALGNPTLRTFDNSGNVTTLKLASSTIPTTTSYTYNTFGEVLTVTDPLGNVTTNTYDSAGNLLSITAPAPGGGATSSVTQFTYDSKGELLTITDPLSNVTTLTYNSIGLVATITDAQSNVTTYGYDTHGNRTSVKDALNHTTTYAYDSGDRLTQITYPDTTTTSFAYDYRGRRTSVTDQNAKTTTYAYDDADRLTSVTDAASHTTTYAYDTENNLTSITDANAHTTSFTYDAFGRVTKTTFPSGLFETYSYDANNNLTSKTDRNNHTITYAYDGLNRLKTKTFPDSSAASYTYDAASKLTQVTDPTGTYSFTFDNMGRLTGTTTSYSFLTGRSFTTAYAYDKASNRTGFTDPESGSTAYAYDTLNRLTTLTPPSAFTTGSFGFSYDALSRRTQMTRPNGVATNYTYDNLSRLLSVLHQLSGSTIDGASYTVDNAGNRTAKTDQRTAVTSNYGYDAIYQLLSATQGATTTENYTYDPVGNRLSSLGVASYSNNSSNELTSTSNASYTYDSNGNTLSKTAGTDTTTYTSDYENRLTSVALPSSGGTVTFKYDPFGRRVQKSFTQSSTTTTTNYVYDGDNLIEEVDPSGSILARYSHDFGIDEPLAMLRSSTVTYYHADGLGSVTSLSNATGALSQTYTFDSFGQQTSSSGSLTNPFRYTAREFDSESNLYFYRARYYSPSVGRFLEEDPLRFGSGVNFFAYVAGDPVDLIDPSGLACASQTRKPKRCSIAVGIPAPMQVRDDEVARSFSGIDITFVNDSQTADFYVKYLDLRSIQALGYAEPGTNNVDIDGSTIYRTGVAAGASEIQIENGMGIIMAHELGHKLLGPGHSPAGIMRSGLDIGNGFLKGIDMTGQLGFTPEQMALIERACRAIRRLHPLRPSAK